MNVVDVEQGSPEWFALRAGKITASRIPDVLATGRGGQPSASRENYCAQLVAEIRNGRSFEDPYSNQNMEDGIENEPEALSAFEIQHEVSVKRVGFVIHPAQPRWGCSPDGLVNLADGRALVQVKCPQIKSHYKYLTGGVVPSKYEPQMVWEMACTGARCNYFVSFNPDLDKRDRLFIVKLERSDARIREIESEVRIFQAEVDILLEKITKLRG